MPTMPPTFRNGPVRTKLERGREHDDKRRREKPWRKFYNTAVWRAIRAQQLAAEPVCRRCKRDGDVTVATIVNHIEPHRGDWQRFIAGPFESLCKWHHDREVQREERAASGPRGGVESRGR